VGHAGVFRVRHSAGFRRVGAVLGLGRVGVIVRRNSRVRKRCRTPAASTLAREFRELLDRCLASTGLDVRYAMWRINAYRRNVRMFSQASFNELNARGTAPSSDRDHERDDVVACRWSVASGRSMRHG
jgi:hypothetical protein